MPAPRRLSSVSYGRQYVDQDDIDAVVRVLKSDRLTQGEALLGFEQALAKSTGAGYVTAVTNGTVALQLAYLALDVGRGSRVVTTANTFLATATTAIQCGAEIEFLDTDGSTGNMDLDALARRLRGPSAPDVVTVVHFAGLPCDMQRVIDLKRRFGFKLVEDAAHALGASYVVDGEKWQVGEHPEVDATTLSFHPVKLITTGEGGAILTHDAGVSARLCRLREHGVDRDVTGLPYAPMVELGMNARMSDMNAALGTSQVKKLPDFLAARREIAMRYVCELRGFELPHPGSNERNHAWHLFAIRTAEGEREALRTALRERGVDTQLHYYPVPLQPWFRAKNRAGSFPNAQAHARRSVSLPIYPALSEAEQARVIDALNAWRTSGAVA